MANKTEMYMPENWQPPKGKLLNPRVDAVFKAIFTSNSEASRNALISFLSAALERQVSHVTLEPNELPVDRFGQKQANFDITCLLDGREPANVEIQTYATDTLFKKRVEYHIAHLLNHFVEKGKKWYDVPKSYQISIVDFIFNSETKNCVSRYEMQTEEKHKLESRMNIIIVELPKIKKMGNIAPEKLTNLEKWGKFFVDADDPKNQEYMQDIACKEKGIMEAQEVLSGLNISYSMWTAQEHHDNVVRERIMMKREQRQMKRETDMMKRETETMRRETDMMKRETDVMRRETAAMKREIEKLKHELETQCENNIQKGAHDKAIETARGMLTLGVNTVEQILQVTGLPLAEIEQLQNAIDVAEN